MAYSDPTAQQRAARAYYLEHRTEMIATAHRHTVANRDRNRKYVDAIKEASPCTDCAASYPAYVMQFDHVGSDKVANVGDMVAHAWSLERIQREIDKCELVCANCHAIRTFKRRSGLPL